MIDRKDWPEDARNAQAAFDEASWDAVEGYRDTGEMVPGMKDGKLYLYTVDEALRTRPDYEIRKKDVGDGDNHWGWRTPLTLAYSDDNGHSWKKYEEIEDDSHNYCYMSMTFIGKKMLLTYYESENREDGTRRNLGSLKMQTVMLP